MICPQCQGMVPIGSPFCPHCGQALLQVVACPRCQATTPPEAQFCPQCGLPFLGSVQPAAVALGTAAPPTVPHGSASAGGAPRYPTYSTFPATPDYTPPRLLAPATPRPPRHARLDSVALVLGCVIVLLAAYSVPVLLRHADWAEGAMVMGWTAGVLAVLVLVAALLRMVRAREARSGLALLLALVVVLAGVGAGSLANAQRIHQAQAALDERDGQWADAIAELRHIQGPSTSQAMVRIYAEWLNASPDSVPYPTTIAFLRAELTSPACSVQCKGTATAAEAQALYEYGARLATRHEYAVAVTQFEAAQSLAPSSTFARLAHAMAASSYYTLGQQELASNDCALASRNYATLSQRYSDTEQGTAATAALSAGARVSGFVTGLPNPAAATMRLSTTVAPWSYFSDNYSTHPTATGAFMFTGVQPGKYNLSATGSFGMTYWHDAAAPHNPYTITVGQLCPVSAGTFAY